MSNLDDALFYLICTSSYMGFIFNYYAKKYYWTMGTLWMTGVPANVCMVSLIASVILMYNSNVYEGVIQIALVHLISYVFASLLIRFLKHWSQGISLAGLIIGYLLLLFFSLIA